MAERATLWLADWSDSEDADFRAAAAGAGVHVRVLRSAPLGPTVGGRFHRLRSWPAYASLAARGLRRADGAPLVAWQPLAGALAGLFRRGTQPPLVVLNPLLDRDRSRALQRLALRGHRRADRIVVFSAHGAETAASLGIDRARIRFVPLGVRARREEPLPPGRFFVAAGREARDWDTLARAASLAGVDVVAVGPRSSVGGLRVERAREREELLELFERACGVVVPLTTTARPAGQLTVLDAMSVGRAVVATRAPGTEDYVDDRTGVLVPPGDADALASALADVARPERAAELGAGALEAARERFSLERFVRDVEALARSI